MYQKLFRRKYILVDRLIVMDDVWALLTDQTILLTFWQYHENLELHIYTFFIQFTQQDKTGKLFLHRRKYLRFFQAQYKPLLSLKFCLLSVAGTNTIMYLTGTFELIDFTLTYQFRLTNNAWPLTLEMLLT